MKFRTSVGCLVALGFLASPSRAADVLRKTQQWDRSRAGHLLARAGFGGTPRQIDYLYKLGLDRAVDYMVDYQSILPSDLDFVPVTQPNPKEMNKLLHELEDERRTAARQRLNLLNRRQLEDLQAWWLRRMITTPRPFEEKMTLFWHGHFTSGARQVRNSTWIWNQNQLFRKGGLGSFRELLVRVSQDPAMLRYLDNASNRKGHPNENYARELLELFTLGEGNYSEKDVAETARAFTGWTTGPKGFRLARGQHDDGQKNILGTRGRIGGQEVIGIILDQPAAARHLARKLLRFFVVPEPTNELVEAFATALRRNRYELRESMRVLFKSEAFYAQEAIHALVKSPVEMVVCSFRLLNAKPADYRGMALSTLSMGQELFQPPNVKGWDGGLKWLNTATLFARYNFVAAMIQGSPEAEFERRSQRQKKRFKRLENLDEFMVYFPGLSVPPQNVPHKRQPMFDPLPITRQENLVSTEAVIEYYSKRLLAGELKSVQRATLAEILEGSSETFMRDADDAPHRIRQLIIAIMRLPEYQVN